MIKPIEENRRLEQNIPCLRKMSTDLDIQEIEDLMRSGHYKDVISRLEGIKQRTLDQDWIMIESYIETGSQHQAEEILDRWRDFITKPSDRARWFYLHGRSLLVSNRYHEAEQELQHGLGILHHVDPPETLLEIQIRLQFGISWLKRGEEKALGAFQKQLAKLEEYNIPGSESEKAFALHHIATIYYYQGQFAKSLRNYKKCLLLKENIGNSQEIARSLNNIGNVYHSEGKIKDALEHYLKALEHIKDSQASIRQLKAGILYNIATAYIDQGRIKTAIKYLSQVLELEMELSNKQVVAASLDSMGSVYYYSRDFMPSLQYYMKALAINTVLQNHEEIARAFFGIARTSAEMGKLDRPLIARFPPRPHDSDMIEAIHIMLEALVAEDEKEWSKAAKLFREASTISELAAEHQIYCHEKVAELSLGYRRKNTIERIIRAMQGWFETYEMLCRQNNLTSEFCKLMILLAEWHSILNEIGKAKAVIQQCMSIAQENGLPLHNKLASIQLRKYEQKDSKGQLLGGSSSKSLEDALDNFLRFLRNLSRLIMEQEER